MPTRGGEIVQESRSGILVSHAFVAAVERAFKGQARLARAVFRDDGRAVARGSLCAFPVDFNLLAEEWARRGTEIVAPPLTSPIRKTVVFCGLPVSVGTRHPSIAPGARHQEVMSALHQVAAVVAVDHPALSMRTHPLILGVALCSGSSRIS
jgi:hypothetical protein